jgi:[ribosomal protein S18]-alanine N-acetyltransferase
VIRAADPRDSDAVTALEAVCQGADAWSAWLVRDGIDGGLPTIRYLVADVAGEVVGYAVGSFVGDIAELQRIGVTPAMRRTGVATALLDEVVAQGVAAGSNRLLLEVR